MSQRNFESSVAGQRSAEAIVSLTSSASWQSAIGRELMAAAPRTHAACLGFQQLSVLAKRSRPAVVIVEVDENNIDHCARFAAEHFDVDGVFVVGVGGWANAEVRHALSCLGMVAFYRSFLDFERLEKCIERFFDNARIADKTIEQRVESCLPWAACSSNVE